MNNAVGSSNNNFSHSHQACRRLIIGDCKLSLLTNEVRATHTGSTFFLFPRPRTSQNVVGGSTNIFPKLTNCLSSCVLHALLGVLAWVPVVTAGIGFTVYGYPVRGVVRREM